MADRLPTGARIRERRQRRGLRQSELAQAVGVSASYLNLIEHGRRRVAGKLLLALARALDLDPAALAEGPDGGRIQALEAALRAAPDGLRPAPEPAQDFLDRFPGWAALAAAQDRRLRALEDRLAEMGERLSHDHALARALHQVITGVTAIRSAAGILTDDPGLDRDWQARFLRNIRDDSEALAEASRTLARGLESPSAPGAANPRDEAEAWLEARHWHLPALEAGGWPDDLPGGAAGALLAPWLRRMAEDAGALPLGPFAAAAREEGHDPLRLARRLAAPLPRVLRRLAALPSGHPPAGLAVADAGGAILLLRPLDGVAPPRAGACPLWPLFEAWATPGRPVRAHAALPGAGAPRVLCHAVAALAEEPLAGEPPRPESTMLLQPAPPAPAPGDRLVGPACRLCPRDACPARREPAPAA